MPHADLGSKLRSYLGERRKGATAFRRAGELLDALVAEAGVGTTIDAGKAGKFQVVDQYARKNTQFKHVGFDRYAVDSVD
ncbi:MAG: hypothetical protein WBC44_14565 [Planctomycetaceae bacterium]